MQSLGVVSGGSGVWTVSVGNGDGQLEGHRGVVSWVVTGCGQWVTSVEGPVGIVSGGGQWCVVTQCGQWVQSVDVVIGVVSGCGQ